MAYPHTASVTVDTDGEVLFSNTFGRPMGVLITNNDADAVLLGGAAAGMRLYSLAAGASISMVIDIGDSVYAHVASGTADVDVLAVPELS